MENAEMVKLKLITSCPYVDIYIHDGETDKAEGLVMMPNHMLRQEHATSPMKEYILVFHPDGTLDALFKRLRMDKIMPEEVESDVQLWDVINAPEPQFDSLFVEIVSQEYYLRLCVDCYEEHIPAAINACF